MRFEDFKKVTQRKNAFDKYWHYFVAISFGLFSLFGLFYVIFFDTGKFRPLAYVIYPGLFLVLLMSISAFYLLPNRYKIIEIASTLNLDDKRKLAESIISTYCEMSHTNVSNYFSCNLKRCWWQSTYKLHFYYDQSRFAFSLQGHDHNGGWIDFGETERKRKKLALSIKNMIPQ